MHSLTQVLQQLAERAEACAQALNRPHISGHVGSKVRAECNCLARDLRSWAGFSGLFPQGHIPAENIPAAIEAFYAMDVELSEVARA